MSVWLHRFAFAFRSGGNAPVKRGTLGAARTILHATTGPTIATQNGID
jgi:hypothetical protein